MSQSNGASHRTLDLKLRIWRQPGPGAPGRMVDYDVPGVSADMSFLEMLDLLNERLIATGEEPVAFEHDCREGICGSCGMMINGQAHGPQPGTATCQLHMRKFKDGEHVTIEPFRATSFPVIRDLMVDPSTKCRICSWQAVVARSGPWAMPLIIIPHMPQMPSRQS